VWVRERRERHQAARLGPEALALNATSSALALELCAEASLTLELVGGLGLALRGWLAYRPAPLAPQGGAAGAGQSVGALWRF